MALYRFVFDLISFEVIGVLPEKETAEAAEAVSESADDAVVAA